MLREAKMTVQDQEEGEAVVGKSSQHSDAVIEREIKFARTDQADWERLRMFTSHSRALSDAWR